MKRIDGTEARLLDGQLLEKERDNRAYLMELSDVGLLQDYYLEAGINQNFGSKKLPHGGWEDPSCQLRGHFLGHYLNACAMRYHENRDVEILAKANAIVHELALCQQENGGTWAASIPEKYFHWIAIGKQVWAPHYTVHKTFMGLLDMYRYAGNREALDVAIRFSKWFRDYTGKLSREEMDDVLDFETGGMLEIWADLYEFTRDEMYLDLISRYDRHRLFDALLVDTDVLTNMHANTTIPEAIGAARVYEVTGIERYRDIALKYWDQAVTERGFFVTGGQTDGEVWTPKHNMATRLGDKNQEHCTVYNMIRLADILFTWTGDHKYLDYIEQNHVNGILAQGYCRAQMTNGQEVTGPDEGLITYFLPLRAGGKKGWGSKFNDFWCCHGTLVQANAAHNRYLFYQDGDVIFTGIYADCEAAFDIGGRQVRITEVRNELNGNAQSTSTSAQSQVVNEVARTYLNQPDCRVQEFTVSCEDDTEFELCLRLPAWLKKEPKVFANGKEVNADLTDREGFAAIRTTFKNGDVIALHLPMTVFTTPLEGAEDVVAFSYGPCVLAGLSDAERTLHLRGRKPEELLVHDNEREWGSWKNSFKTRFQDPGIRFVPLKDIVSERYQVYFPVEQ